MVPTSPQRPEPYHLTIIDDRSGLDGLIESWRELWARSPNATPYNHDAWVLTWLDHFACSARLHAVVLHRGGELAAVAPFVVDRGVFICAGAELADNGSPLLGDAPEGAGDEIADHLAQLIRHSARSVALLRVAATGPLALSRGGRGVASVTTAAATELSLAFDRLDDPVAEVARLAKKRDVPRLRRRLDEQFAVAFASRAADTNGVDELLELSGRRERDEGEQGLFASAAGRAFARDVLDRLGRHGVAKLSTLTVDGRPLAIGLGYAVGDRYVGHKLAIDDELSRFGPGNMLINELACEAIEAGLREYSMGRGDAPYKRHWCNVERGIVSLAVVRSGPAQRAQLLAQRAVMSRRLRRLA